MVGQKLRFFERLVLLRLVFDRTYRPLEVPIRVEHRSYCGTYPYLLAAQHACIGALIPECTLFAQNLFQDLEQFSISHAV